MLYLAWRDDSKAPVADKLAAAQAALAERFPTPPSVILVNIADKDAADGQRICVGEEEGIPVLKNCYYLGYA